jgi:opacity protein-like surface antigen
MISKTLVCFLAGCILCCGSLVEAQVTYSLGDGAIRSAVKRAPVRRVAKRVRDVIPAFDENGRFNRAANYEYNSNRLLGGLFAADFELTATVFGGWNRIAGFAAETPDGGNVYDDDFAVGFAYGRRHSEFLRSEFEFTYRSNDVTQGDSMIANLPNVQSGQTEVMSIMKNLVIDVHTPNSNIMPYLGVGIGYAHVNADFNRESGLVLSNSSTFAWQPIGGVNIKLTPRSNFFVEYRYFSTLDLELKLDGEIQNDGRIYNAHNMFMGLRFEF